MAEIVAHPDDLFEHLLEAITHLVLRQLRLERPGHPAGKLVLVRKHGVLVGDADRMPFLLGDATQVVADPTNSIEIDHASCSPTIAGSRRSARWKAPTAVRHRTGAVWSTRTPASTPIR